MSRQSRLVLFTLEPSAFSSVACIILLTTVLMVADWAFITQNPLLYHYLFGPDGLAGIVHPAPLRFATTWHHLTSQLSGSTLASYLFVLLIVVILYTILELVVHTATSAGRSASELLHAQLSSRQRLFRELGERAAVRFIVALLWGLYTLTFFRAIVPWCVDSSRFGIATISDWRHLGYIALSFAILLISLHVQVIFLRSFMLRARVFDGTGVLLAAEQKPTVYRH